MINGFVYFKVLVGEKSVELLSLVIQEVCDIKFVCVKDCLKCFLYKVRFVNCLEELKEKN